VVVSVDVDVLVEDSVGVLEVVVSVPVVDGDVVSVGSLLGESLPVQPATVSASTAPAPARSWRRCIGDVFGELSENCSVM